MEFTLKDELGKAGFYRFTVEIEITSPQLFTTAPSEMRDKLGTGGRKKRVSASNQVAHHA